ncbi:17498_t:CDS:1, partial [Racocetra fulgida]
DAISGPPISSKNTTNSLSMPISYKDSSSKDILLSFSSHRSSTNILLSSEKFKENGIDA